MVECVQKVGFICQVIDCPERTPDCKGPGERLVTIQNFVNLAPGSEVPLEGSASECPACGRTGIEKKLVDGVLYVVHVQTTELLPDGMVTEAQDTCHAPKKR